MWLTTLNKGVITGIVPEKGIYQTVVVNILIPKL
jgi:hypothetical protein